MDSNEFYGWIKDTLNREDTLDARIPQYVQAAVRYIERKSDFSPMEWWADFTLDKDNDQVIALPKRTKAIEFLRIDTGNGSNAQWEYITGMATERTINRKGKPKLFWLNTRGCLILDAIPDKDYPAQLKVSRFSEFPPMDAEDGIGHWLLDHAPDALHARTMYMMSMFIREDDPRIMQSYGQMAEQAIRDLMIDDEFYKESGKAPEMVYWPEHVPYEHAFRESES